MRGKGGPSNYCAPNQASRPSRGSKGAVDGAAKGTRMARAHEAPGKSGPRKRGKGKIKSTGKPRFTRFSKF